MQEDRERLGMSFEPARELEELTRLREKLKAGLAGVPPEDDGEKPCVAGLAERIKALKAGNTVEAEPQRMAKRQVAAQESVTTTIRRREQEGGERARRVSEEEERKAVRG